MQSRCPPKRIVKYRHRSASNKRISGSPGGVPVAHAKEMQFSTWKGLFQLETLLKTQEWPKTETFGRTWATNCICLVIVEFSCRLGVCDLFRFGFPSIEVPNHWLMAFYWQSYTNIHTGYMSVCCTKNAGLYREFTIWEIFRLYSSESQFTWPPSYSWTKAPHHAASASSCE